MIGSLERVGEMALLDRSQSRWLLHLFVQMRIITIIALYYETVKRLATSPLGLSEESQRQRPFKGIRRLILACPGHR